MSALGAGERKWEGDITMLIHIEHSNQFYLRNIRTDIAHKDEEVCSPII